MRLQEHRQSYTDEMNSNLKHVTILEEAHHLLRKTQSTNIKKELIYRGNQ